MENCYVTQLKASVDNDSLLKLGEIEIDVHSVNNPIDETQWLNFAANVGDSINVEVIGDGYIIKGNSYASGTNVGKNVTINDISFDQTQDDARPPFYYLSNGDYKIRITSKYDIDILTLTSALAGISLENFRYSPIRLVKYRNVGYPSGDIGALAHCTDIPELRLAANTVDCKMLDNVYGDISVFANMMNLLLVAIPTSRVSGNISVFANKTNMREISLWDTNIEGDIASLANLTNLIYLDLGRTNFINPDNTKAVSGNLSSLGKLTSLLQLYVIRGTNVQGSIESLVQAWRTNGKTSGSVRGQWYGNDNVTFNGEPLPAVGNTTDLVWTADTITCNGVTINA